MGRVWPSHWLPPGVTHRPGEGALWCQASPLPGLQWTRWGGGDGLQPLPGLGTETGRQGQAQKGGSWREDTGRGKAEGRKREVGSGQHPPPPRGTESSVFLLRLGNPRPGRWTR